MNADQRPSMLADVTAAVVVHRRLPSGTSRTRYLGAARSPEDLARHCRECAQHLAATQPCPSGKVRFRTEADAVGALARSILSRSARRREQRRYRCGDCGDWHLTSLRTWSGP